MIAWFIKLHELLEVIAQINSSDQMTKPIPLLGTDREEYVSTVQGTRNTHDACVYSTGKIDDLSFTVHTQGYDPKKLG